MATGENPFFNRGPIFDPQYFFGREREQRRIMALLKNMQCVAVVGLAKAGKTSLLLHLARPETQQAHGLDPETYVFTYLNLEGIADFTPERFFHWMLRETGRQGETRRVLADLPKREAEGSVSFPELLDVLDRLGRAGARLVYLIDEFELATANHHFDLNFFSALRAVASLPHVALVTETDRPLHELVPADRDAGSPLANLFTTIRLGRMERDEAARLARELSASTGVSLDPHLDFIADVTGGWPYGMQILCSLLWDRLAADSTPLAPADREYLEDRFCHEAQSIYPSVWARFGPQERQTFMAVADPEGRFQFDPAIAEQLAAAGPLSKEDGGWRVRSNAFARFVRERAAEERAHAETFLAVDQADQRPTHQVTLPSDKQSIYSVVRALVKASESRNPYFRGHSDGTTRYAVATARQMSLSSEEVEGIKVAARLHDIGHIGVSDLVLLKPGALTPNETEIVRAHVLVSVHILEALEFPWLVKPAVRSHHERWDGTGYPDGLMGEEIPLAARILAVADVADAMTSDRPWRSALPLAEALAELRSHAGTKYDPRVVEGFLHVIEHAPQEPPPEADAGQPKNPKKSAPKRARRAKGPQS